MPALLAIGGVIVTLIVLFLILGLIFGGLVMVLWNALMPDVFGLAVITWWQGTMMFWLSSLLFRGFSSSKSS